MSEQPTLLQRAFSLPGFGLLLALLIFACFPDVLLGRSSFYFRDYGVLGFPVVHHLRESYLAGEVPLWNPLSNCGVPFFAQWGTMCAYPLSAILLLPLPWSLSVFCFFHLWLAGMGMYLLARRWTANDFASAFAGAAFVFSGIMFSSFIWPNYLVALAWMPFVVLLAERAWCEGGRLVVGAGIVSALQLGSGAPELIFFTWLIAGVLWLLDFAEDAGSGGRMFVRAIGVVALASALMAVQLLPFFELLKHSQRDDTFVGTKWSLPTWAAANFIAPLLNCFETPQGQYFQYGQEFLSSVYLGVPVVALALIGVMKFRTLRSWALLALAVFAVLLAFGDHTPVFPAVRKAIPLFAVARYPVKFLFIPAFVLPLLASLAIRALHVEPRSVTGSFKFMLVLMPLVLGALVWAAREHLLVSMEDWPANFRQNATASWKDAAPNTVLRGAIFLAIVFSVLFTIHSAMRGLVAGVIAIVLLAVDARIHVPNQNPTLSAPAFRGSLWDEAVGPRSRFGESRVFITPQAEEFLVSVSSTNAARVWDAKRRALWSHLNLLEAAPKVNGSATLQVREQARLQKALYETNSPAPLLDFLGVAYVNSNRFEWTRRPGALPLITAGQQVAFIDDAGAQTLMLSPDFDPRASLVLPPSARATVPTTNRAELTILSSNLTAHRIQFTVEAQTPGMAVIAQSFFPAWSATVDGTRTPLYRANAAFQALLVPAGRHEVRVEYRDQMFRAGALISIAALAACPLLWWVLGRRRESSS